MGDLRWLKVGIWRHGIHVGVEKVLEVMHGKISTNHMCLMRPFSHESIEGISDHLESRFARAFYKSQKEKVICTTFDLFCNLSLNDLSEKGYVK